MRATHLNIHRVKQKMLSFIRALGMKTFEDVSLSVIAVICCYSNSHMTRFLSRKNCSVRCLLWDPYFRAKTCRLHRIFIHSMCTAGMAVRLCSNRMGQQKSPSQTNCRNEQKKKTKKKPGQMILSLHLFFLIMKS